MEKSQAIRLIEDVFDTAFSEEKFTLFCTNLLNDLNKAKATPVQSGPYVYEPYRNHIKNFKRIGQYTDPNGELLDILSVKVHNGRKLERTRTGLRNFAIEYLKRKENRDTLLIAFHSDDSPDWRFSFIKLEYKTYKDEKGKIKARQEATSARRYSFLVGENEPCHTAKRQLLPLLLESAANPTLAEIEQCFNIEKVTKEFFEQYKTLFVDLQEQLETLIKKDKRISGDFESKNIESAPFAKKLLGQIVFLYFIQKKGWLGVPKDKSFGQGEKRFLKFLFKQSDQAKANYFNNYLEPLFYEALAVQRSSVDPSFYKKFNCRIPFLNGGLFEPIKDYDWQNTEINLPNEAFSNTTPTKEGDIGTGILDVFDRYNFTVKEDEPLEKEVAVDPEMLGKVFENLLEIKDRKSKGAYYTPREIVHYMCQESLINYLDTALNSATASYQELALNQTDLLGNTGRKQTKLEFENKDIKVPKNDIDAFIKNSHLVVEDNRKKNNSYTWELPDSIQTHAKLFDTALADIKVCDPAIGSGAFPVGMLNEIVKARTALTPYLGLKDDDETRTQYHLKRECIQASLYGVDIDESAIDIAKLRLWLSLVVDEDSIQDIEPLPNLDYKIVCGNSLRGIVIDAFNVSYFEDLEEKKKVYFSVTDPAEKRKLHKEIDGLIYKISNGKKDFDFELYFSEIWHRPSDEVRVVNAQIAALNKQIDAINTALNLNSENEIIKLKFIAAYQQIGIIETELKKIEKNIRDFFGRVSTVDKAIVKEQKDLRYEINTLNHWIEVVNNKIGELNSQLKENAGKSGFDVLIGNPPYIQIQKFSGTQIQKDLANAGFQTFSKTGDIFSLFYEKGIKALSSSGFLCFISNDFTKTKSSSSLRNYIAKETNILSYTDFSSVPVFDATTYPVVLLLSRNKQFRDSFAYIVVGENEWNTKRFVTVNNTGIIKQKNLLKDNWILKSGIGSEILQKIIQHPQLKSVFGKSYRGILTGFNEAFIIDSAKQIKNTAILYEGKDIHKWKTGSSTKRIILFKSGWTKSEYGNISEKSAWARIKQNHPQIAAHLEPFEEQAKKRYDKGEFWWELRACGYYDLFDMPKIIFPNLQVSNKFAFDESGCYINAPAVFLSVNNKWLLGILNSRTVWYFLKNICVERSGGYIEVKPQYFEQIPIPNAISKTQKDIATVVENIINDANENLLSNECVIDARVAHLYSLTESEYQLILEGTEDTFRITALNYFRDIQKGILK
ncbi:MAG: TaqI-like C-terminal specificity domain-containing protein [Chitinivibrionales bacterium]|nr:TaqI-like C-terminal specificity domain-containing protein [Chitinivibrionales bacterium]